MRGRAGSARPASLTPHASGPSFAQLQRDLRQPPALRDAQRALGLGERLVVGEAGEVARAVGGAAAARRVQRGLGVGQAHHQHAMVQRFREERAMQTAGSLAFTTLLSLVPLLAVVLAASTAFPVFDQAIESLQLFILENVLPDAPGVDTITEQVNSFMRNAGRLTAIGIAGFVVTSVMLMLTIDNAMNRIFRVQRRRSTLQIIF